MPDAAGKALKSEQYFVCTNHFRRTYQRPQVEVLEVPNCAGNAVGDRFAISSRQLGLSQGVKRVMVRARSFTLAQVRQALVLCLSLEALNGATPQATSLQVSILRFLQLGLAVEQISRSRGASPNTSLSSSSFKRTLCLPRSTQVKSPASIASHYHDITRAQGWSVVNPTGRSSNSAHWLLTISAAAREPSPSSIKFRLQEALRALLFLKTHSQAVKSQNSRSLIYTPPRFYRYISGHSTGNVPVGAEKTTVHRAGVDPCASFRELDNSTCKVKKLENMCFNQCFRARQLYEVFFFCCIIREPTRTALHHVWSTRNAYHQPAHRNDVLAGSHSAADSELKIGSYRIQGSTESPGL
ncbi:hypothetical protein C8R45DRAFT_937649 [Mycena sanguinolenta]|nr:hypothetical protein C8R45DRAFT_937649 [Mycena sanguinolenta]